jgi:hypothetical protein
MTIGCQETEKEKDTVEDHAPLPGGGRPGGRWPDPAPPGATPQAGDGHRTLVALAIVVAVVVVGGGALLLTQSGGDDSFPLAGNRQAAQEATGDAPGNELPASPTTTGEPPVTAGEADESFDPFMDLPDPCTILTDEELADLLGVYVVSAGPLEEGLYDGLYCLVLTFIEGMGIFPAERWDDLVADMHDHHPDDFEQTVFEVDGLGETALWASATNTLFVLDGEHVVYVPLRPMGGPDGPPEGSRADAEAVAAAMVEALRD